ncbi:MAG: hypothetical protein AVDCRST_MAG54-1925, partial [uncultured Actinomycetospora sp.]
GDDPGGRRVAGARRRPGGPAVDRLAHRAGPAAARRDLRGPGRLVQRPEPVRADPAGGVARGPVRRPVPRGRAVGPGERASGTPPAALLPRVGPAGRGAGVRRARAVRRPAGAGPLALGLPPPARRRRRRPDRPAGLLGAAHEPGLARGARRPVLAGGDGDGPPPAAGAHRSRSPDRRARPLVGAHRGARGAHRVVCGPDSARERGARPPRRRRHRPRHRPAPGRGGADGAEAPAARLREARRARPPGRGAARPGPGAAPVTGPPRSV